MIIIILIIIIIIIIIIILMISINNIYIYINNDTFIKYVCIHVCLYPVVKLEIHIVHKTKSKSKML